MRTVISVSLFIFIFLGCASSDDNDEFDFCAIADQSSEKIVFSNITIESIYIPEGIRGYVVRADVTNISDSGVTGDCFIVVDVNGYQAVFGTPSLQCSIMPPNFTCEFISQANATENSILDNDIPVLCFYYLESE